MSFFLSLHSKVFRIENLQNCSVYIWLPLGIFFYFEALKFEFFKVSKTGIQVAWELKAFFVYPLCLFIDLIFCSLEILHIIEKKV
jgi:hypothetical protein